MYTYSMKVLEAENSATEHENRFPTLLVNVGTMLAAFLSLVCGLILDTNAKNSRKNFEVQMNLIKMIINSR